MANTERLDDRIDEYRCAYPRTLRWYEWLLLLLILVWVTGVRAASVYQCADAQGAVAFQDKPCASAQQAIVELAPAPAYAPPPVYAVAKSHENDARHAYTGANDRGGPRSQPMSFECRVADGRVFYQHTSCPRSIAAVVNSQASGPSSNHAKGKGQGHAGSGTPSKSGAASVSVSSLRVPRDEACAQMHAAGAIGRNGHDRDETASTYERNLGHDPCR